MCLFSQQVNTELAYNLIMTESKYYTNMVMLWKDTYIIVYHVIIILHAMLWTTLIMNRCYSVLCWTSKEKVMK